MNKQSTAPSLNSRVVAAGIWTAFCNCFLWVLLPFAYRIWILCEFYLKGSRTLQGLIVKGCGKPTCLWLIIDLTFVSFQEIQIRDFWYVEIDLLRYKLYNNKKKTLEMESSNCLSFCCKSKFILEWPYVLHRLTQNIIKLKAQCGGL